MIEFYPSDQIESRDAQRILPYEPLIRGEVASWRVKRENQKHKTKKLPRPWTLPANEE